MTRADVELLRVRDALKTEFPDFRMVRKTSSKFMWLLNVVLRTLSLGYSKRFMEYTTTIGDTIYVSESWVETPAYEQAALLRHEGVHMRQRRRLGRLRYTLTYLFWVLPVIYARGRRDLEMEAYRESLRAYFEYFGEFVAIDMGIKTRVVGHFLSSDYFWMWPFRVDVERWYDDTIAELLAETRNSNGQNQAG